MVRSAKSPGTERAVQPLSLTEARRMALAGQGFAVARPARVNARKLLGVAERVGVLQLDSVTAVCRSHYLPMFARLGKYDRSTLDRMAWGSQERGLFEYWGHRASMLPLSLHRLVRWRMQAGQEWNWAGWSTDGRPPPDWSATLDPALRLAPWAVIAGMARIANERPSYPSQVLALVGERGPVSARELHEAGRRGGKTDVGTGTMWNWQDAKIVLEWLFFAGLVTTATRRGFERVYDLTERVIPPAVLSEPTPDRENAQRGLMLLAARACGVGTERQLRDYFHLPGPDATARLHELVEAGELQQVRVEGIAKRMYARADAESPAQVSAQALLSPFDSLIWDRDRVLRLFGFRYRISIYTKAADRAHGYWVMPFLLGDRLVARVDLKADRSASTLMAQAAHGEVGVDPRAVAGPLATELALMADWLELDRVVVADRGDLASALAAAVALR
jgi:uncharacterized protein